MKNIKGSDIRMKLVSLSRKKKIDEYDVLVNDIINDNRAFKRLVSHCNKQKDTFSKNTLENLYRAFQRFQEDAKPESWDFLHFLITKLNKK